MTLANAGFITFAESINENAATTQNEDIKREYIGIRFYDDFNVKTKIELENNNKNSNNQVSTLSDFDESEEKNSVAEEPEEESTSVIVEETSGESVKSKSNSAELVQNTSYELEQTLVAKSEADDENNVIKVHKIVNEEDEEIASISNVIKLNNEVSSVSETEYIENETESPSQNIILEENISSNSNLKNNHNKVNQSTLSELKEDPLEVDTSLFGAVEFGSGYGGDRWVGGTINWSDYYYEIDSFEKKLYYGSMSAGSGGDGTI